MLAPNVKASSKELQAPMQSKYSGEAGSLIPSRTEQTLTKGGEGNV